MAAHFRVVRDYPLDDGHAGYADTGCEYHPACLTCPFEVCIKHERIPGDKNREQRLEIYRRHEQGQNYQTIATALGVSKRTVRWHVTRYKHGVRD